MSNPDGPRLSGISIHAWLLENRIVNEKSDPIEFRDHPFLYDIYRDESPNLCVMKGAQLGMSTLAILKVLYTVAHRRMDCIYTLPTQQDAQIFVGGKVNRIIASNKILQDYTRDKDTIEQKQVFGSMLYVRGTFTEREAIMVTADWLIADEADSSDMGVVEAYESRLQHSRHKWRWVFSHPSVPGHGVSKYWEISDRKRWHVDCALCGKAQPLEWPDSIDVRRKMYVCVHCGGDIGDRRKGRWVAERPGAKWSGYRISLLDAPWVTAEEIVDKFERHPADYFFSKVLGLPYTGEGNTVPLHVIQRCVHGSKNSMERVVIGCDSGLIKHWVAGNREGIFAHGKAEKWEEIEALLNRFPRSVAILDALPDLTAPRDLRKKYPGRVYLANFTRDRKTMQIARWGSGREEGSLLVDRHRAIQSVVDGFHKGSVILNGTPAEWEDYIAHWQNLYRVREEDSMGRPVFLWEKKNPDDHFALATTLLFVGLSRFGGLGEIVRPSAPQFPKGIEIGAKASMPDPGSLFQFEGEGEDWRR